MAKATGVRLLDGGSLVIDQAHITWNLSPGNPVRFPCYSVLIEHPDGLLLFDSGYDIDVVNEKLPFELPEQTLEQTIPGQLALCGYGTSDIAGVINSHLHFDHVGGNRHFPDATVYVHEREVRQARSPEPFEHLGYADRGWDFPGVRLELLDGDVEIADGVHLFHTPGHTVGHYSLMVEMDGRSPLLFVADVSYTPDAFERGLIAGFHNDPVANVRSIRRVKRLARQHGAELFFSHDMEAFRSYRTAPDQYAAEEALA